ncbi:hypothetical protein DBR11_20320 [Pedobacter sp. HMWF019]|nr:hypothetical protein DBR11_20320 [Pedobacter sp. HMWF019]
MSLNNNKLFVKLYFKRGSSIFFLFLLVFVLFLFVEFASVQGAAKYISLKAASNPKRIQVLFSTGFIF